MTETTERHPTPVHGPRRSWRRTFLLGTLILLFGIVIGSALTFMVLTMRYMPPFFHPERMPDFITERLRHELDLSDEQTEAVRGIFTRGMDKVEAIRAKFEPEMDAQMESVRTEVEAVLNPDQARRWNALSAEMRERWGPPGPMRPPRSTGAPVNK